MEEVIKEILQCLLLLWITKKMCKRSVIGEQVESVRKEVKVEASVFKVLQVPETAS